MPITIGTLTSNVSVTDGSMNGKPSEEMIELIAEMVVKRLKDLKGTGGDDDIPDRKSDSAS